jgi:hypothetical protein
VALLEFFTSVADGTKDVGEATVLGKMVGRVAVNDCIDSLCILGKSYLGLTMIWSASLR